MSSPSKVAITIAVVWDGGTVDEEGKPLQITTVGELGLTALGGFNQFVLVREEGNAYFTAINPRYIRYARLGLTPEMSFEGEDLAKFVSIMTAQTLQSMMGAAGGGGPPPTSGVQPPSHYG